jgi:hypothetical protein
MSSSKTQYKKSPKYDYKCIHCDTSYTGRREQSNKNKRFCRDACRQAKAYAVTRKKKRVARIEDQLTRWCKSGFGLYAIQQARKAGTVMILMHHTTSSLFDLEALHNRYYKCYGWDRDEGKSFYDRCHVQARKGSDGSVGVLHATNLFIGSSVKNRAYSNRFVSSDAGMRIAAYQLKERWTISCEQTNEQVADMIRAYLGKEFSCYLAESDTIKLTRHYQLARRIYNRQQKGKAARELEKRYTVQELEVLDTDVLEEMDAYQRGKSSVSTFRPDNYTRASLCVYAEELERFATVSPSERQRGNCRFMLGLVRVLGVFIAQMQTPQGIEHGSFLRLMSMEWKPFEYRNWQQPWGRPTKHLVEADQQFLISNITEYCFDTLAGADIPQELLRARLLKRIDLVRLTPTVLIPCEHRYKAFGSWVKFIEGLYAEAEPIWQWCLDLGLCNEEEVTMARHTVLQDLYSAITEGRLAYSRQSKFHRFVKGKYNGKWGFKGYPAHLEYPPIDSTSGPESSIFQSIQATCQ